MNRKTLIWEHLDRKTASELTAVISVISAHGVSDVFHRLRRLGASVQLFNNKTFAIEVPDGGVIYWEISGNGFYRYLPKYRRWMREIWSRLNDESAMCLGNAIIQVAGPNQSKRLLKRFGAPHPTTQRVIVAGIPDSKTVLEFQTRLPSGNFVSFPDVEIFL